MRTNDNDCIILLGILNLTCFHFIPGYSTTSYFVERISPQNCQFERIDVHPHQRSVLEKSSLATHHYIPLTIEPKTSNKIPTVTRLRISLEES